MKYEISKYNIYIYIVFNYYKIIYIQFKKNVIDYCYYYAT